MTAELAAFHAKYKDLQQNTTVPLRTWHGQRRQRDHRDECRIKGTT
jgi:hypothetical protein